MDNTDNIYMINSMALSNLIKEETITYINLHKCSTNSLIYSAFALYGSDLYTVELKNGIVISFYSIIDNIVKFKIIAGDKCILEGKIINAFYINPTFDYEEAVSIDKNLTITELEQLQSKWELISSLLSIENLI